MVSQAFSALLCMLPAQARLEVILTEISVEVSIGNVTWSQRQGFLCSPLHASCKAHATAFRL